MEQPNITAVTSSYRFLLQILTSINELQKSSIHGCWLENPKSRVFDLWRRNCTVYLILM